MSTTQFHLAQFNVAQFKQPRDHPQNRDFVDNIDQVNASAEIQPGFIWRLDDEASPDSQEASAGDPNMINNLSVWENTESLSKFVYRTSQHRTIMRRRTEWFAPTQVSLVLWWIPAGHIPTLEDAKEKLALLQEHGPTAEAFTFKQSFPPPSGEAAKGWKTST